MNRYFYRAKDKNGKLILGEVEAASKEAAARLVRKTGLVVISISTSGGSIMGFLNSYKSRITTSDVANFTRQLSTMINAGLPVTDALAIQQEQSQGNMKKVISQILADVEGGESLSTAFVKHPNVFSPIYVALLKSGEVGGVLDEVTAKLADGLEKQEEFKGRVKTALIYPAIIVLGMLGVGVVMMTFVIPKLTALYTDFDAELPLPTKILIGMSSLFTTFWPVVLLALVGGFYAYRAYRKTAIGRYKTDELLFKIPIIGKLQKEVILTEVTRTLALMVGAGVSILESLNITSGVVTNTVISDAINDVSKQVEKGFPLAYSFAKHSEAFPFILSQMVAVGEETGKLDEVLSKVSHVFEVESDQQVKTLTAAVEPLVMIILGLGVGFLVIAIILPIYNLTSSF